MSIQPDLHQIECLVCKIECLSHFTACLAGCNEHGEGCPYKPWHRPPHAQDGVANIFEVQKRQLDRQRRYRG